MINQKMIIIFAAFLLGLVGTVFLNYQVWSEKKSVQAEIDGLTKEKARLVAKLAREPGLKKELDTIQNAFADLVGILPSREKSEVQEEIYRMVYEYARRTGIKVQSARVMQLFDTAEKQGSKRKRKRRGKPEPPKKQDFQKVQFEVVMKGNFYQFMQFLNQLERTENFQQVDSISVQTAGKGRRKDNESAKQGDLTITLTTSTFIYQGA